MDSYRMQVFIELSVQQKKPSFGKIRKTNDAPSDEGANYVLHSVTNMYVRKVGKGCNFFDSSC